MSGWPARAPAPDPPTQIPDSEEVLLGAFLPQFTPSPPGLFPVLAASLTPRVRERTGREAERGGVRTVPARTAPVSDHPPNRACLRDGPSPLPPRQRNVQDQDGASDLFADTTRVRGIHNPFVSPGPRLTPGGKTGLNYESGPSGPLPPPTPVHPSRGLDRTFLRL